MNYGDPTDTPMGRASIPGPPGGSEHDGSGYDRSGYDGSGYDGSGYDGYQDYGDSGGAAGRASVSPAGGRAAMGSAAVGSAAVGSAAVGSSSVPSIDPTGGVTGRASVPGARSSDGYDGYDAGGYGFGGSTGRAAVTGRASVRASAPVGVGPGLDPPGGRAGIRPPRDGEPGAPKPRGQRRRNILIAGIAAAIMLLGVGMVGGTWYVEGVDVPVDAKLYESTTIFYSDGTTPMAKIGVENRTILTKDKIPDAVKKAVVATEDMSFYDHDGIDYRGIARAAWNNFTGGELQGASTINQQYARHVAKLKGVTYGRKLREAVIASKLNSQMDKDDILQRYLNAVYFGRHAYGVEAAAQAYFGRPSADLKVAEAMVLAGLIKDPAGQNGRSPFDPTVNKEKAEERFNNYIKPNMVKMKYLTQEEADKLEYPTTVIPLDPKAGGDAKLRAQWGLDKPEGHIVHQVMSELTKVTGTNGKPRFSPEMIKTGGLQIKTTIQKPKQDAAVLYASGATKESELWNQPPNLQAALVAVEPLSGRVRAYYAGAEGDGSDYAHWFQDPVLNDGEPEGYGFHQPASSFKVYTLAAALVAGYSLESRWDGTTPREFPNSSRTRKNPAGPVSNNENSAPTCGKWCTLIESTAQSLNTPYFAVAEEVGWAKVAEAAALAGVRTIKDNDGKRYDIAGKKARDMQGKIPLSTEIGIGQFPVTVLDHANGLATFAADGMAAEAHFVEKVHQDGKEIYSESIAPKKAFDPQIARNVTYALSQVGAAKGSPMDRATAGKTGTWQLGNKSGQGNAHTWMVGYVPPSADRKVPGLATAVWIGNKDKEEALLKRSNPNNPTSKPTIPLFGSVMAAPTYRKFMAAALKGTKTGQLQPAPIPIGHKEIGNGEEPTQAPPPPNDPPGNGNGPGGPPNPSGSPSSSGPRRGGGGG